MLQILVSEAPKALSKLDLQDRLWPNTFVVEKNLANLAAEIRDALGDDAARPQFLRTVPRFGYAFRETAPGGVDVSARPGTPARFRLVWVEGQMPLPDGEYTIGRDPDVELFFDSPSVSRRHAIIRIKGCDAAVEDLGSKNGTFVGDSRIDGATPLSPDNTIRIGSIHLTLRSVRAAGSTKTELPR